MILVIIINVLHNIIRGVIMESNKADDINAEKEVDDMSIAALDERYCTIQESIIESFKEVKLMREGKLPKKSWKDFMDEHKKREENE